jgi:hypothetical protein
MRGAFVIRLGEKTNPCDGHFEGSVEEVDSGKELKFKSSTELLSFLGERFQAGFEEMSEDESPMTPENKPEPGTLSKNLKSSHAASRGRRQ